MSDDQAGHGQDGENRGAAMAASVARTARFFGVPPRGVARVNAAHATAMAPRAAALDDDHHPLYLHPGRTVLVLLRDVGVVDPVVLAAAALTESEDARFRIGGNVVRSIAGDDVAELVAAVPMPGREDLAEELIVAPGPVCLIALAERLDHVRHAHLREASRAWRRAIHEEVLRVYLPVAERTHEKLATRYRHWGQAFARRLARTDP